MNFQPLEGSGKEDSGRKGCGKFKSTDNIEQWLIMAHQKVICTGLSTWSVERSTHCDTLASRGPLGHTPFTGAERVLVFLVGEEGKGLGVGLYPPRYPCLIMLGHQWKLEVGLPTCPLESSNGALHLLDA